MTQNVSLKSLMGSLAGRDAITLLSMSATTQSPLIEAAAKTIGKIAQDQKLADSYSRDHKDAVISLHTRETMAAMHNEDIRSLMDIFSPNSERVKQGAITIKIIEMMRNQFSEPQTFPIDLDARLMIISETGEVFYATRAPDTDTVVLTNTSEPVTMTHTPHGVSTFIIEGKEPFQGIVRILKLSSPEPSVAPTDTPEI